MKQIINLMYLVFPGMLFYAPFHTGDYSFFKILRLLVTLFCGYFTFISGSNDDYFSDTNERYPKIFLGITIFFGLSLIPYLVKGLSFSLPRVVWNIIDYLTGGFLLFYFIERKIYHRKYYKKDEGK
jgi:hypothetical protein